MSLAPLIMNDGKKYYLFCNSAHLRNAEFARILSLPDEERDSVVAELIEDEYLDPYMLEVLRDYGYDGTYISNIPFDSGESRILRLMSIGKLQPFHVSSFRIYQVFHDLCLLQGTNNDGVPYLIKKNIVHRDPWRTWQRIDSLRKTSLIFRANTFLYFRKIGKKNKSQLLPMGLPDGLIVLWENGIKISPWIQRWLWVSRCTSKYDELDGLSWKERIELLDRHPLDTATGRACFAEDLTNTARGCLKAKKRMQRIEIMLYFNAALLVGLLIGIIK